MISYSANAAARAETDHKARRDRQAAVAARIECAGRAARMKADDEEAREPSSAARRGRAAAKYQAAIRRHREATGAPRTLASQLGAILDTAGMRLDRRSTMLDGIGQELTRRTRLTPSSKARLDRVLSAQLEYEAATDVLRRICPAIVERLLIDGDSPGGPGERWLLGVALDALAEHYQATQS
jgi:hypothetical protein